MTPRHPICRGGLTRGRCGPGPLAPIPKGCWPFLPFGIPKRIIDPLYKACATLIPGSD